MGLSYDQKVQERIVAALERIEKLIKESTQTAPSTQELKIGDVALPTDFYSIPLSTPKRRGRPPKVTNG